MCVIDSVETEVLEQVERCLMIEAILELDSACWNHPLPDPQRRVISDLAECEALAEQVRAEWQLGLDPIPNLTQLLGQHGIKVLLLPLPAGAYGLICLVRRPEREAVPCIVVNRVATLERRRLTLAHELGHRLIDDASPVGAEAAAKHFASAFLVPAASVRQDFGTYRHAISPPELMPAKRGYRVSAAALLVRCERLGILSHSALAYAFQTFARGWRTVEPEPTRTAGAIGNAGSAGTVRTVVLPGIGRGADRLAQGGGTAAPAGRCDCSSDSGARDGECGSSKPANGERSTPLLFTPCCSG